LRPVLGEHKMMQQDYQRIASAIDYLIERRAEQPSLDEVAAHVGLSRFHFQRLFKRYAGVSPKQFLAALTLESAKSLLDRDEYMLLADFQSYSDCQQRVDAAFRDPEQWTRMAILNVARMGWFSSDRSIREYCEHIWKVKPVIPTMA